MRISRNVISELIRACYLTKIDMDYRDIEVDEKEPYNNRPIKKLKTQTHSKQNKNAPIQGRNY